MSDTDKKKISELPEKRLKKDKFEKRSKRNALINVMEYLQQRYDFRYNLFAAKPEYRLKQKKNEPPRAFVFFDERAFDNMIMDVKIDAGIEVTKDDFRSLIGSEQISEDYDPIKQYLFKLPPWAGEDRFRDLLQRVLLKGEDIRKHFIKSFPKWFVGMVASIIDEKAYNENCLVLCGSQGIGKTRFLVSLVPE